MELSLLAAKQKRLKDWAAFVAQGGVQAAQLKSDVLAALDGYKKVLAKCWEAKKIDAADEAQMRDFERRLEEFNEESRMTVVGRKSGVPARVI